MKETILISIAFLFSAILYGQFDKQVEQINIEGMKLYCLEKASWVASDILFSEYQEKQHKLGGYFSYANNGGFTCVFVSVEDPTKASIVMTFDSTFSKETVSIDTLSRELTLVEKDLFEMRLKTMDVIEKGNKIKFYKNTNFNIIPIIEGEIKKVYVMTATTSHGHIILGNDYLLKFNAKNKLKMIEPLHKSIIPFEESDSISWSTHTHIKGFNPFMTATDICTLLLYGDQSETWHRHLVISEEYVSIWNYSAKKFVLMKSEVFFSKTKFE